MASLAMVLATRSGRRVSEARERLSTSIARDHSRARRLAREWAALRERHKLPMGASDCARWYQTRENWDSKRGTESRQGDVRDRDRLTHRQCSAFHRETLGMRR